MTTAQRNAHMFKMFETVQKAPKGFEIAKRIKSGWTDYQANQNAMFCDDCGSRLWVAPDGKTKYCDNNSELHK